MEQKMKLVLEQDVITGFSYSFSKALLDKLKELKSSNGIFDDETEEQLTSIASSILDYLGSQIKGKLERHPDELAQIMKIDEIISIAEEFLNIFQEEK